MQGEQAVVKANTKRGSYWEKPDNYFPVMNTVYMKYVPTSLCLESFRHSLGCAPLKEEETCMRIRAQLRHSTRSFKESLTRKTVEYLSCRSLNFLNWYAAFCTVVAVAYTKRYAGAVDSRARLSKTFQWIRLAGLVFAL
jgi:hypothetical protein